MERFSRLVLVFCLAVCYLLKFLGVFSDLDFTLPVWQVIVSVMTTVLLFIAAVGTLFSAFFVFRSFNQRSCYAQAKKIGSLALSVGFFVNFFIYVVVMGNKLLPVTDISYSQLNYNLLIALSSLMGIFFLESFGSWSNSRGDRYRYRNNMNNRYGGRGGNQRRYQGGGGGRSSS